MCRHSQRLYRAIAGASLALVTTTIPSRAAQVNTTWDGGAGFWSQLHWDSGTRANPTNDAVNTFNVFIDSFHVANSSVFLDSARIIDNLQVSDGDILNIQNGTVLQINAGSIGNGGTITLLGTNANTYLTIDTDTTLSGAGGPAAGGTLTFSPGPNHLQGVTGNERLTNVTNTIQGAGNIGNNTLTLTNQALVDANVNGNTMTINPADGAGGIINTGGTLRASNGGVLSLTSADVVNTGGTIRAQDGSRVDLSSITITGGTLASAGTGFVRSTGGSVLLSGVTNTGDYRVANGTSTSLAATFTNNATLRLEGTNANTYLLLSGNVTLAGTGAVTLPGGPNHIQGTVGNERLTNQSTIQGAGNLGNNTLTLTNQSLIDANQAGATLVIDPADLADAVVNSGGTLRASNGGVLALAGGAYNNTGGTVQALAGSRVDLSSMSLTGGNLSSAGTGVVRAVGGTVLLNNVSFAGTYRVVNGASTTLAGTFANAGNLSLDGTNVNTYLTLSGNVTLTGAGAITLPGGPNHIQGNIGNERLTNQSTIQGAGNLGNNAAAFTNNSLIDANAPGLTLTIDPADIPDGVINTDRLRASNGGILSLTSGTFNNAGGTVAALAGSRVDLSSLSLTAGTLDTDGSGIVRAVGGNVILTNVTSTAQYHIVNGASTHLAGTFTNAGDVFLDGTNVNTHLYLSGNVTLNGGGTINLPGGPNHIQGAGGGERLTNVNNTIRGAGNLGNNVIAFTNQSVITADINGGILTIDPADVASALLNSGTLRAANGGILSIAGATVVNTGAGVITALDASHVRLSSSSVTGGSLTVAGSGDFTAVGGNVVLTNVTSAAPYHIANGQSTHLAGTLTNTGTVFLDGSNANTFLFLSGDVTLNGGGTVTLPGGPNHIQGAGGVERLTNVNNTIQGAGNIGNNTARLTNQSLVDANRPGGTLTIDPADGANGVINTGTLRASNGGILALVNGTFNNANGTVSALADSRVDLASASLTGGTLTSAGSGFIRAAGGTVTLTDLTNAADYRVANGASTHLAGTINNTGSISLTGTNANTFLFLSGDLTLTGGGTINLPGGPNHIQGAGGVERLTNQNNTIQGGGNLGNNVAAFTNNGTILANSPTDLVIDPSAGGITNNGLLRASAGSRLIVTDGLTNFSGTTLTGGSYYAAGTLRIAGANIVTNAAAITLDGPTSALTDTAGPPLDALRNLATNNGSLTLTNGRTLTTAGDLTNNGNILLGPGAALKVVGTLTNPGTLDLSGGSLIVDYPTGGPSPLAALQAMITSGDIISTTAANHPQGIVAIAFAEGSSLGGSLAGVPVDPTSVVARATFFGDANLNGTIDRDDFALTDRGDAMNLTGWSAGDFDADGDTDAADYLLLDRSFLLTQPAAPGFLETRQARFGNDYVARLVASVPEPAAATLFAFAYGSLAARRRRISAPRRSNGKL